MGEELKVKLLGSPAAFVGDEPLSGFVSIKAQALLYYLAATGISHRRDALAALLWSDVPDATARKNLRDILSNLRRLIGPFLIITRHAAGLNPDAQIVIDSQSLSQTLTTVRDIGTTPAPQIALQTLAEAAAPRQGEFLAGFYPPEAPLFEEWMLAERERLRLELGDALESLTAYSLAFEDYTAAEAYARRQLELDSYREEAHRQLLTALALSNRRAEAVAHYEILVDLLWHELGLEPAEKTQGLFAKIRAGETVPVAISGRPEVPTDNLPLQLTSFVGREKELVEISQLLEETRFLTLTGAGGSGKTRLAIEVAAQAKFNYADGVTYVSLASTRNPEHVVNAVARELNIVEQPGQSLEGSLRRYLARKNKLLILDNFEHLLEAALLVSDLLRSAPHLTVLVTSRQALNLSGEYDYLVPPLTLPDMTVDILASALMAVDSVDLFVQRARMVFQKIALTDDNAAAIAGICLRLDGLPLAIELAAARIRLFSPQRILEELDDRLGLLVGGPRDTPHRQRTLRGTIDWSYNLLNKKDQLLLARLAVFNGSRTIEAVDAVCACGGVDQTLHGLESLLKINLLFQKPGMAGETRLYMLQTIHEYAHERLCESGEKKQVQNRHLDYYLHLVEGMSPGYMEQGQIALFQQTDVEMDNIKTAFEWALASRQIEKAARLLSAINYYLRYQMEHLVEGYHLSKRLLPDIEQISPQYRIPLLISAADLAFLNNDLLLYRQLSRQAISLARGFGDKNLVAWSLAHGIDYTGNAGALEKAVTYGEEAIVLFGVLDNKPGMAYALNRLGEIYRLLGDLDRAKKLYEESLVLCRETGEIIREDILKADLSLIAYGEEDYGQARDLLMSVIRQRYSSGWIIWTVSVFALLSGILAKLAEPQKAARTLGACHRLMSEMGIDHHPYDQSMIDQSTADIKALLDESAFKEAWAEGQLMTYEQLKDYVLEE